MLSYSNSLNYSHKFIKKENPASDQEKYKRKYKFIKRAVKDIVLVSRLIFKVYFILD